MMNLWLDDFAHHEANIGYHKTVMIATAKQVFKMLLCSLLMIDANDGRG